MDQSKQCETLQDVFMNQQLVKEPIMDFLHACAAKYFKVSYHSFDHAVDVTTVLANMLYTDELSEWFKLDHFHCCALLISAVGHDLLHPGLNNLFQINAKTPAALQYNNESVLENQSFHCLKALFEQHNILEKIEYNTSEDELQSKSREELQEYFVQLVHDLILSTDMKVHFNLQLELQRILDEQSALVDDSSVTSNNIPGLAILANSTSSLQNLSPKCLKLDHLTLSLADKQHICKILLHAADISNAVRPFDVCKLWSDRVVEEFFQQGEEEKRLELPISPNMDRSNTNQYQLSIEFNDIIIAPFFQTLADLAPSIQYLTEQLTKNRATWQRMQEQEKQPSTPLSASLSVGSRGRKMSIAAGTVDIPSNLTISNVVRSPSRLGSMHNRSVSLSKPVGFLFQMPDSDP